jgi:hypothetical protein
VFLSGTVYPVYVPLLGKLIGIKFGFFVMFFPQLIAGQTVPHREMGAPELKKHSLVVTLALVAASSANAQPSRPVQKTLAPAIGCRNFLPADRHDSVRCWSTA